MSKEEIKKKQEFIKKLRKFLIVFHVSVFVIVVIIIVLKLKNIF